MLFFGSGPEESDAILGSAKVGRVVGVARVTHGYVEVETFKFGKAGDGEVKVSFGKWGGETRGVDLLANGASCFFKDVAPCFNEAAVTEVSGRPARADDRVVRR